MAESSATTTIRIAFLPIAAPLSQPDVPFAPFYSFFY
jgi:hypothetical protein